MNFKKFILKFVSYYFNDITKLEDFNIDNNLIDDKSYKNILISDISYESLIGSNLCILDLIKQMDLLEFMMKLDI